MSLRHYRCALHGTQFPIGERCSECPPRDPILFDSDCRLFVVVSVAAHAAIPAQGCNGCLREIPKGERFIEYSDAEYFPAFCRSCVLAMHDALKIPDQAPEDTTQRGGQDEDARSNGNDDATHRARGRGEEARETPENGHGPSRGSGLPHTARARGEPSLTLPARNDGYGRSLEANATPPAGLS